MSRWRRRKRKSPYAVYSRRLAHSPSDVVNRGFGASGGRPRIGPSSIDVVGFCSGRSRLSRRHDLVGGASDEFGHVIELERETADAGGGRAHLDDQIADLRLRHLHAYDVPPVPAFAGVEAENLAAPPGHQRIHFRGRL